MDSRVGGGGGGKDASEGDGLDVRDDGEEGAVVLSRVEVNQRALIDKILARYASQNAVYRELIQNSNDADASEAEIHFATNGDSVTQVVYRNNGLPFRGQDWDRLKKIAEGNPNPEKVGAFGVGAYTMFSICEEPMVLSGGTALTFVWRGDALWTRKTSASRVRVPKICEDGDGWTTFVLDSRDPYPLPSLTLFGEFLCASLTFTGKLRSIQLFVDGTLRLSILKSVQQPPRLVQAPVRPSSSTASAALAAASSTLASLFTWGSASSSSSASSSTTATSTSASGVYSNDSVVTKSAKGVFALARVGDAPAVYESIHRFTVTILANVTGTAATASLDARYVSATAQTFVPSDMCRRMERVTKKQPPKTVSVQIFLNAGMDGVADTDGYPKMRYDRKNPNRRNRNQADKILQSFAPRAGSPGRIFIGFRTSQTTGFGAHLAAPFVPTVEREAMDLQDDALRLFNTELLEFSGMIMRLTLEHTMFNVIGAEWEKNAHLRMKEDLELMALLESGDLKQIDNNSVQDHNPADDDDNNNLDDENTDDDPSEDVSSTTAHSGGKSWLGFARFMKGIASVAKTVGSIVVDATSTIANDKLLHPPDPRPLSAEEKQAVVLMQSFCPQQSTPDPTIGMCLANGFARCLLNQSPPVLTRSGVVRGDLGRLPHYGMEQFCPHHTIRTVVYQNCVEYHTVIARCTKLTFRDLHDAVQKDVLDEDTMIKLMRWWVKYVPYDSSSSDDSGDPLQNGLALKQAIRFHYSEDDNIHNNNNNNNNDSTTTSGPRRIIVELKNLHYYYEKDSYFATRTILPLPDTSIPRRLQEKVGFAILTDRAINHRWFVPLPIEVWAQHVCQTPCMTEGRPEDEPLRIQILACLSQEYMKRPPQVRTVFAGFCHTLLTNKRCIPFDSPEPTTYAADYPGDLYLSSAELKAFQGVGDVPFRKVAESLKHAGVSDDFLLCLGVRQSVSIDFLFTNLDQLKWNEDPKALIEYLKTATLNRNDKLKLSNTQYLPAENDRTRATYAPSQLYLPNTELRNVNFPFVRLLQWPSETDVSEKSSNGQFLVQLGMKTTPPLVTVLQYLTSGSSTASSDASTPSINDPIHRMKCLDYLSNRLAPHGTYQAQYHQLSYDQKKQYRFLPCTVFNPIEACFSSSKSLDPQPEYHSPVTCYSDGTCAVMGFPVLNPKLMGMDQTTKDTKLYGSLFLCPTEPEPKQLLNQLGQLVALTKQKQRDLVTSSVSADIATRIEATFATIFNYLSHSCSASNNNNNASRDFYSSIEALKTTPFIPVKVLVGDGRSVSNYNIEWYRPDQVFFRKRSKSADADAQGSNHDEITSELFHVTEFNAFLAATGVKDEATTRDLFIKLVSDPEDVLRTLGSEKKYRALLRRIAANPPFHPSRIPAQVRNSPFLLAYTVKSTTTLATTGTDTSGGTPKSSLDTSVISHHLAKANDIYIIDNSFYARMFPVNRAPPESDLEDFYARLGSKYISQSVDRRFEIVGRPRESGTELTRALKERLEERSPLLVSPSVTSRPLVHNAASLLDVQVHEVQTILAVYSLNGTVRRNQTTCCSREVAHNNINNYRGTKKHALYVVKDFDWFDVGNAIGDLILKRCQLEDAFFISSLLEAPLEQLRNRGFPVDRIMPPPPPPVDVSPPKPPPSAGTVASMTAQPPPPTIVSLPPPPSSSADPSTAITTSSGPVDKSNEQLRPGPPTQREDPIQPSTKPQSTLSSGIETNDTKQSTSSNGINGSNTSSRDNTSHLSKEGMHEILMQMFPDADPNFIIAALGNNPTIDDVRVLAEAMSSGNYPKKPTTVDNAPKNESPSSTSTGDLKKKGSGGLRKKLGRALGFGAPGGSSSDISASTPPPSQTPINNIPLFGQSINPNSGAVLPHHQHHQNVSQEPVSPASDAHTQSELERMLEKTVSASSTVNPSGVQSNETKLTTSIPEGLDHSCEVIPSQSLKPFLGPRGNGMTLNGIRVFSSRQHLSSETFLLEFEPVLESFAHVIERLCLGVFGLNKKTIAIFHDPVGSTIAFNSNRSLHFNVRFFYALHYLSNKHLGPECYSYWYMTIAHELAHHMVTGHTREHGFYTESYASHYMPKLLVLLQSL